MNWNDFDFSNAISDKIDDSKSKFKIGQEVKIIREREILPGEKDRIYLVKNINYQDENSIEYALDWYSFLVYEEELEEVK